MNGKTIISILLVAFIIGVLAWLKIKMRKK